MNETLTFADIKKASERIASYIQRTPVLTSTAIDELTRAKVFFKCENFQKVGAFKFRGACNRVFALTEDEASKGVVTHSSGNHAQALALAAKMRGIKAYIVMPENAPAIKVKAVKGYGGEVTFCKATLKDREETASKIVSEIGAYFIHPYNDLGIIAGQGTCAMEIFNEVTNLDIIMTPVGGGGLLSGTAIASAALSPETKVWAAEPLMADDAARSFEAGKIIPQTNPQTMADGLRTNLGSITFPIILEGVDRILTCSEESILRAMRLIWERMKLVVEPSGAVPLAVILEQPELFSGKKVAVIITGGNIDLDKLPFRSNT